MASRQIVGTLAITAGLVIIFLSLGNLIFRIIMALFGVWLVNYGMRLTHRPPLFMWAQRNFYRM